MIDLSKAISIWQPWASLIVIGAKTYETRGWETKYRGKIAIHAAKKKIMVNEIEIATRDKCLELFQEKGVDFANLPYGAIIGTAELVNCWKIIENEMMLKYYENGFVNRVIPSNIDIAFGNWTPGRYAWELANAVMFEEPIPCKGQQRLWNWEGEQK